MPCTERVLATVKGAPVKAEKIIYNGSDWEKEAAVRYGGASVAS